MWLKKGVDAVIEDPDVFSSQEASVTLGVGKNMVDSIRYWCRVSGLIETVSRQPGVFVPTELGEAFFGKDGFDPYLDDPATLWFIHWQIATHINQATTWYWAFNIFKENRFTFDTFITELSKWASQQRVSKRPVSDNTFRRDVTCFIRTYCASPDSFNAALVEETFACPLVELNLIGELPEGAGYEFQRGRKETLPVELFTATLIAFWDKRFSAANTLRFQELMYEPLSPGRIFRIDEDTMTLYLDRLEELTAGVLRYDDTAGLKQLHRDSRCGSESMRLFHRDSRCDSESMRLLKQYYDKEGEE